MIYFNSHAHVERDTFFPSKTCVQEISTHTLTWSVTYGVCLSATHLAFQLTRSRGAWQNRHTEQHSCGAFQLTRSRGAWLYFIIVTIGSIIFQLTRSRGAWPLLFENCVYTFWFQLTRSRGAWPRGVTERATSQHFNSHAHVERDLIRHCCHLQTIHFNSHAHVERDVGCPEYVLLFRISTHTLTWSVTVQALRCGDFSWISTHTLTWSVTVFVSVIIISPYFNSHAHVERDALCQLIAPCRQHFNSHAHVERDLLPVLVVIRTAISTHTLTWSVTKRQTLPHR